MINKNASNFSQGLTLIELLIASVLSVIIFLLIANTLLNGLKTRNRASAVTELQKASLRIVLDITNEVRWAKSMEITGSSDVLTVTDRTGAITKYEKNSSEELTKTTTGTPIVLHSSKIKVTAFDLTPYPDASNPNRVTIDLKLSHRDYSDLNLNTTNTMSMRISQVGT